MDDPRQPQPSVEKKPQQGGVKSADKPAPAEPAPGGMLNQGDDVFPAEDRKGGMIGEG